MMERCQQERVATIDMAAARVFARWRSRMLEVAQAIMPEGGKRCLEETAVAVLRGTASPHARAWRLFWRQGNNTGLFDYPADYPGHGPISDIYESRDLIRAADFFHLHCLFAAWATVGHYDIDGGFCFHVESLATRTLDVMLERLEALTQEY